MTDPRKDLPPVSAPNFNERLRETISTYLGNRGNPLDRGVTLRDLSEANIIALRKGFLSGSGGKLPPISGPGSALNTYEPDLTPPPTPSGFTASAAISHIFIECDAQPYPQGHGHAKTVVYGAIWTNGPLPVFGDAVKITEFSGTVFAHPTNPATTWHLWIKWVTVDGVESAAPAGGTNGVAATTGQDVKKLVEAMTGPGNPFKIVTTPITLADGTIVPVGTYTSDAYMASFVAARGQIGLLAVDDARIASLKVSKLEGDSLKVGSYIRSSNYIAGSQGFAMWANGLAEFSNVVVRGTVYATAGTFSGALQAATGTFAGALSAATGTFSGALQAATGTFSGSISAATGTFTGNLHGGQFTTGSYTGYGWPSSGGVGSYLGPYGLLIGNANDGRYVQIEASGNIHTPGFSVINGVMTIHTANVINTLNIAGNAVTVPVSASSDTDVAVGGETTLLTTPWIDAAHGSVVVMMSVDYTPGEYRTVDGDSPTTTRIHPVFYIYRNGLHLKTVRPTSGTATALLTDVPSGGATYTLTATGYGISHVAVVVHQRAMVALGVRR